MNRDQPPDLRFRQIRRWPSTGLPRGTSGRRRTPRSATPAPRAAAPPPNGSGPHSHQSTGLSACWSRYGEVALASRLATPSTPRIAGPVTRLDVTDPQHRTRPRSASPRQGHRTLRPGGSAWNRRNLSPVVVDNGAGVRDHHLHGARRDEPRLPTAQAPGAGAGVPRLRGPGTRVLPGGHRRALHRRPAAGDRPGGSRTGAPVRRGRLRARPVRQRPPVRRLLHARRRPRQGLPHGDGWQVPLWRVHGAVFAVLALESEPVDPRL